MKTKTFALVSLLVATGCAHNYRARNGDIVFQTSRSAQSLAIQLATRSPYSHMGIVYLDGKKPQVYEASTRVVRTPLSEWTAQGVNGHFVVKRLKDARAILTRPAVDRMKKAGDAFQGKDYDFVFEWSDDRIYCSELVWKVFDRGLGIQLSPLQVLRDFDLTHPAVRAKVNERWNGQPPLDEPVISPQALFDSPRLVTVHRE